MAHTYEELKGKTVAQLREIAADMQHDALQGYTQLNKEHLLAALCKALNLDAHAHRHAAKLAEKSSIKVKIREFKKKRDAAMAAKDHKQLEVLRSRIRHLKRTLRKAMA